jgi:hypothetical protein
MFTSFHSDPPKVVIAPIQPEEKWIPAEEITMEQAGVPDCGARRALCNGLSGSGPAQEGRNGA